MAPTAEASTVGGSATAEMRPMITSWANSAPAIGALNEAEIADATPAASKLRPCRSGNRSQRAKPLARLAPRWTTGPSRPALAPEPSESADTLDAQRRLQLGTTPGQEGPRSGPEGLR